MLAFAFLLRPLLVPSCSVNNSNIKANTGTATKLKKLMKEKDAEVSRANFGRFPRILSNLETGLYHRRKTDQKPPEHHNHIPTLINSCPVQIFRLRSQLATLNVDSGRGEENNGDDENDKSIRLAMTGHQEVLCTPAKTTASSSIDDDIENECPLCMSPLKKNPNKKDDNTCSRYVVITHCGHQFHLDCLQRTRNFDMNNCPMCREDLPPGITPFKEKEKVILANRSEGHVPPRYVPPTQNNNDVFHGNGNNVDDDENAIVNPANNNRRSLGRRLRRRSNNNNNENNNGGDLRVNQSKACVIS